MGTKLSCSIDTRGCCGTQPPQKPQVMPQIKQAENAHSKRPSEHRESQVMFSFDMKEERPEMKDARANLFAFVTQFGELDFSKNRAEAEYKDSFFGP